MIAQKIFIIVVALLHANLMAQNITFEEYKLENGLHVILHQEPTVPLVVTAVMYHVGAKDENPNRTGFAHFFEHLLFEGTKHIPRGQFMKIVEENGGALNANTSQDRTYYYEFFPSNKLELALWLESERMLHPVINKIGVSIQNEVVKEEKRERVDNAPYGRIIEVVNRNIFKKHPYRWTTIGSMEHLDAATLDEFKAFNQTYYVPNNAVLVVAGNIDINQTKIKINDYFGPIPRGKTIPRISIKEPPITKERKDIVYDPNIQIPMSIIAYRTPSMKEKDSYTLELISTLLSRGKSSRLYKKMVDHKKHALQVAAINLAQEQYGVYIIYALPMSNINLPTLITDIEEEIETLQTTLISEKEFQKLQNIMENKFVNSNSTMAGIANSLARFYMLYGDTNLINKESEIYQAITREDIQFVANKYLNKHQRVIIDYYPEESK